MAWTRLPRTERRQLLQAAESAARAHVGISAVSRQEQYPGNAGDIEKTGPFPFSPEPRGVVILSERAGRARAKDLLF